MVPEVIDKVKDILSTRKMKINGGKKQGLSIFFPDKVLKKIKNAAAYILIICLLSSPLTMTANAAPEQRPGPRYCMRPETVTFFSQNPDERLPIASITKIMTALVVLENCNRKSMSSLKDSGH